MAESPSFDYLQGGYTNWNLDGISGSFDGYQVSGSKSLNKDFFIAGDYQSVSKGSLDAQLGTIGLGYKHNLTNTTAFFGQLDWANANADGGA